MSVEAPGKGEEAHSTIPEDSDGAAVRREKRFRAVSFLLVGLTVGLAAIGLLGVRSTTTTEQARGYTIEVSHASVTRPGLATPFGVEVSTADDAELPPTITIRIDASYLAMFDDHGMEPTPDDSYNTTEWTWWTFEIPEGRSTFLVEIDARIEPSVQWGRHGSAVLELEGDPVVEAEFSTWVMP